MKNLSLLLLAVLFCLPVFSQKLPAGPQVLTFFSDMDDTEQPYALYLPPNFSEKKKYPLVVMLHGAGSNHRLELRRVFGKSNAPGETDVEASLSFPKWKDVEYIVAAPYARGTAGYQGFREKDVLDMLADVKKRFKIDENRTYLTGLSMGGGGTLWLGLSRPDLWAAIAPVCPAPPAGTEDLQPNALNLAMHFFHGDADQAVPVKVSRDYVKSLRDLGTPVVEYKEYPGVNHNSWENAYADGFIFDWFSKFVRDPNPGRVRFVAKDFGHAEAYWVRFDQFTPGTLAKIDARRTAKNEYEITTSSLDGFTLKMAGSTKMNVVSANIDGQKVRGSSSDRVIRAGSFNGIPEVSFFKENGQWKAVQKPAAAGKKRGSEGPIAAAFAERHLYIYGTADNPSPEVLKARMDSVLKVADWSVDRGWFLGRIKFYPRVVADKDVRPSDLESSHLILFGTKETNLLVAKYADRLPMQLKPEAAADFGLFYVFPMDGKYVAVCSGQPWWTSGDTAGWRFLPQAQMQLLNFKDFVFYKKGEKIPILEGYFNQNWQLSDSDASVLKKSGVVNLK